MKSQYTDSGNEGDDYMITDKPVGVLDSGVGGISILRALVRYLPCENFVLYGDTGNVPYGDRSEEEIHELTMNSASVLLKKDCKAVVVACNTATAAAIKDLRQMYPDIPMIGLEPALKPAVLHKKNARIIVMATSFTLKSQKYLDLRDRYVDQAEIISLPCPGIVPFVERQETYSPELLAYLHTEFAPYLDKKIDGIVLGCTHFPFVKRAIREVVGPDTILYDSADGVGRQVMRQLESHNLLNTSHVKGTVELLNSKGPEGVELCRKLLYQSI